MPELDRLVVRIEADTGGLRRSLARAAQDAAQGGRAIQTALAGLEDGAGGGAAALDGLEARLDDLAAAEARAGPALAGLGRALAGAFEDAVVQGEDLGDVLDGLLRDLSRIGLRSFVTAPLAAATGDLATGSLSGFGDLLSLGGVFGDLLGFAQGGTVGRGAGGATSGGTVRAAAGGELLGRVSGPGTGTSDSIPALLSAGEFVVSAAAARDHRALLEAINAGALPRLATGGIAAPPVAAPAPLQRSPTPAPANVSIVVNVPPGTPRPDRFGRSAGRAAADAFAAALDAHRRFN